MQDACSANCACPLCAAPIPNQPYPSARTLHILHETTQTLKFAISAAETSFVVDLLFKVFVDPTTADALLRLYQTHQLYAGRAEAHRLAAIIWLKYRWPQDAVEHARLAAHYSILETGHADRNALVMLDLASDPDKYTDWNWQIWVDGTTRELAAWLMVSLLLVPQLVFSWVVWKYELHGNLWPRIRERWRRRGRNRRRR